MNAENEAERVWRLISDLDYCMLVTRDGSKMRSRPMSTIPKSAEHRIYILTSVEGGVDDEIGSNPAVLMNYSNGSSKFVSLSGSVTMSSDRALIERLWNPGAQAFWPQGPSDPRVIALVVVPEHADVWDGNSGLLSAVKFAISLVSGSVPDLGDRKSISLN